MAHYKIFDENSNLIKEFKTIKEVNDFSKTNEVYAISKVFDDKNKPWETTKCLFKRNKPFVYMPRLGK